VAVPEDLFGLLGIFPTYRNKYNDKGDDDEEAGSGKGKKGKSKGRRRALRDNQVAREDIGINEAFTQLDMDDKRRTLKLAEDGDKEQLFGLLGIFPTYRNKYNKDEDVEVESSGKAKKPKSKGRRRRRAASRVNQDSGGAVDVVNEAFNQLNADDKNRALKLAEDGDKEQLFGLLGIFPTYRNKYDKDEDVEVESSGKKKVKSKGKRL